MRPDCPIPQHVDDALAANFVPAWTHRTFARWCETVEMSDGSLAHLQGLHGLLQLFAVTVAMRHPATRRIVLRAFPIDGTCTQHPRRLAIPEETERR